MQRNEPVERDAWRVMGSPGEKLLAVRLPRLSLIKATKKSRCREPSGAAMRVTLMSVLVRLGSPDLLVVHGFGGGLEIE